METFAVDDEVEDCISSMNQRLIQRYDESEELESVKNTSEFKPRYKKEKKRSIRKNK